MWKMFFTTDRHGFNLRTLYRCVEMIDCPTLLVIQDNYGKVV